MEGVTTMKPANGYIVWEGLSEINHSPIVVIATGFVRPSRNTGTGNMIQVWIMPAHTHPVEAARLGLDQGVCGRCPRRPSVADGSPGREACYVALRRGPTAIFIAYKLGRYPRLDSHQRFAGRRVRFGAWGDPLAVPDHVWSPIRDACDGWTGYSHVEPASWLMVSVDTPEQASAAAEMGFRYFRVGAPGEAPADNEVLCPKTEEAGKRTTCEQCGLCDGTRDGDRRRSVFAPAHDTRSRAAKRRLQIATMSD